MQKQWQPLIVHWNFCGVSICNATVKGSSICATLYNSVYRTEIVQENNLLPDTMAAFKGDVELSVVIITSTVNCLL